MKAIQFDAQILQKDMNELRTSEEVAKKYGCHKETILRRARKMKLEWPSDNQANHDFFSTWSRPMAYILGIITADGGINYPKPYVTLDIKSKDIEILKYCRCYLNPAANFYKYERVHPKTGNIYESSKLMVYSQKMVDDLKIYSVFPNKTGKHLLDFDIPNEYFPDYTRGFFDGDGSVYYKANKINSKITCKSWPFLAELAYRIGINFSTEFSKNKLMSIKYFYKTSIKLRDFMYQNEEFALTRKKERFFNPEL